MPFNIKKKTYLWSRLPGCRPSTVETYASVLTAVSQTLENISKVHTRTLAKGREEEGIKMRTEIYMSDTQMQVSREVKTGADTCGRVRTTCASGNI